MTTNVTSKAIWGKGLPYGRMTSNMTSLGIKKAPNKGLIRFSVASFGFEPKQLESKSSELPLFYKAILII